MVSTRAMTVGVLLQMQFYCSVDFLKIAQLKIDRQRSMVVVSML